ncbi:MAG TPA: hypothetical protein VF132_14500, partial [Rudaea sp.]
MKSMLTLALALAGALAATFSVSACAKGAWVDVSVIDRDTGATLAPLSHDGKLYVAGVPGHRYSVRIANRTGARVLTVLSVDGVNAVTGQTASPEQSGYVLDPYQSTEVEGWRKSLSEIAQFNFTALGNSYAARTGRAENVGVIGVAVFREKPLAWRERDEKISRNEAAAQPGAAADTAAAAPPPATPPPAPAAEAPSVPMTAAKAASAGAVAEAPKDMARRAQKVEESLGTGHGAREASYASYTTFERESNTPNQVVSIWYDSFNNLVARGVIAVPPP